MNASSQPTQSGDNSTTTLLGGDCPKCKSTEAWHGVITEAGEAERFACDECGMWLAVSVRKPKPPKPAKRPISFMFEIDKGRLFIDWRDSCILAFKPGRYLAIGDSWELLSAAEVEEREEQASKVDRTIGREQAEKAAAEKRAS